MFKLKRRLPRILGLHALGAAKTLVKQTLRQQGLFVPFFLGKVTKAKKLKTKSADQRPKLPAARFRTPPVKTTTATFLASTYTGKSGSRLVRTYVPKIPTENITGIVMMLHGCTQNAEDFAAATGMNALAQHHGFIVIYPEQSQGDNAQTCWNWFRQVDQKRVGGEPEILAAIAHQAMLKYKVDRENTFVCGLSAGGAMAVILGRVYPDIFSAIGVHSGLPYGAAYSVPSALTAMAGRGSRKNSGQAQKNLRTIVFHGAADNTVHPLNGEHVADDAKPDTSVKASKTNKTGSRNGRKYDATIWMDTNKAHVSEHWTIQGLGHAWSGGNAGATFSDPKGPDASAEMIRFFFKSRA